MVNRVDVDGASTPLAKIVFCGDAPTAYRYSRRRQGDVAACRAARGGGGDGCIREVDFSPGPQVDRTTMAEKGTRPYRTPHTLDMPISENRDRPTHVVEREGAEARLIQHDIFGLDRNRAPDESILSSKRG